MKKILNSLRQRFSNGGKFYLSWG